MFTIFLDTEVFKRENLHFGSRRFKRLVDLVEQGEASVCITDVTLEEVRAAIDSAVRLAIGFLEQRPNRRVLGVLAQSEEANLSGIVAKLNAPALVAELHGKLAKLLESLRAIVVSTDDVPVSEIRRRYFENLPPFSAGSAKKYEFPDAMSILAIEYHARTSGLTIHVVSGDKGIADAVQAATGLEHVCTLQEMTSKVLESAAATAGLAKAAESAAEMLVDQIAELIGEQFCDSPPVYVDDENGDADEVTVDEIDIDQPTVAEVRGNTVRMEFLATIDFSAAITIDDPDQSAYDHETGETYVFGYRHGMVSKTVDAEGEVEIEVNLVDPSQSRIISVALSETQYGISFHKPDE